MTGAILTLALAGCTRADLRMSDAGIASDGPVDQSADMGTDRAEVSTGQGGGAGGIAEGTGGQPGTGGGTGTGGNVGTGGAPGTGGGSAGSSGSGGAGGDQDGGSSDALPDASLDAPAAVTPSAAGQLVISEIMADSDAASDDFGEWFEVYNPSAAVTLDLFKCVLADTANTHTVSRHVIVAPNGFATLARFGDISGGFVPDYNYNPTGCTSTCGSACPSGCPTVKFSNSGDKVSVTCGATVIDSVDFSVPPWVSGTPLVVPHGHTYSLDPRHYDATENDMFANWCLGSKVYNSSGGTDYGSPGVSNPLCPSD